MVMTARESRHAARPFNQGACEMRIDVPITGLLAVLAIAAVCSFAGPPERYTAEGVIRGPNGQPVQDAQVRLYIPDYAGVARRERTQPSGHVITGEDGRYTFTIGAREADTSYGLIVARKEGLAWNCRRWPLLADMEADIRLAPPEELAGVVLDGGGRPIPEAKVTLQSPRSTGVRAFYVPENLARELLATKTDRTGRFRFTILSADWQTDLVIEAAGYATIRTQHLPDTLYRISAPGQTDLQFRLKPEARIQGTVVSESDGEPIAGVEVRIGRTQTSVSYGFDSTVSAQDGRFSFAAVPEGEFWVGVATSHVPDTGWVGWPIPVRTKAGETTGGIRLELTRGGMFEATVRSDGGDVIQGAGLTVFDEPGHCLAQGRTDAEGLCRFRLPAGRYKLVDVGKWGYHTYEPYLFFDVERGETVRREVTLKKAERIDGIVVDDDGRPVSDVQVTLMPSPTGMVLTDNRGRFAMIWDRWFDEYTAAPPKKFELIALDPEGGRAGTLAMQEGMGPIRLALKPAVRVIGTVVDAEGQPVEAAMINPMLNGDQWGMNLAPSKHLLTDRSGRFTIGPVPSGRTCEIHIRAQGREEMNKEIQTPAETDRPFDLGKIRLMPGSDSDG